MVRSEADGEVKENTGREMEAVLAVIEEPAVGLVGAHH